MVEPDRLQVTIYCSIENMQFACWITKARIHTPALIIFNTYCFIINYWIPSDLIKCFTGTLSKTEKLHNNVSVIMNCLAKLYIKRRPTANKLFFFCFSAVSGTLHEDLHKFYCYQWHKFTIKALWTTHYFCIVDSDV